MWIVKLALRRPYTFVVMAILMLVLGTTSIFSMRKDIFPHIDIPVVSIVWAYSGISPQEMADRIVTIDERAMTTTVNDIEHIESTSYQGTAVVRVFFQPGVKVELALAQITALSQTILRPLPPGIFPPNILSYDASSVPILQLALGSDSLSEQELYDFGQNFIRTQLATVQGASLPLPYGGKSPTIMVDLDPNALYGKHLSATDISNALSVQNLIVPAGTAKVGDREFLVQTNSSPRTVEGLNELPIRTVDGATVYVRDVAQVRQGYAVQTNIVRQGGRRSALLTVLRNGTASTLDIVNDVKEALTRILAGLPQGLKVTQLFDQSLFVRAAINGVLREGAIAAALTALMILLFLGSWRSTLIVCLSIPLSILTSLIVLNMLGETINVMTLGGLALSVGILVDDATVEIENIHRNMAMKKPITRAILDGAQQIAIPAFVSTLSICVVFVPVLLLVGAARFLFTPLAGAVVFAMLTLYLLTRTLVPTMAHYLLKSESEFAGDHEERQGRQGRQVGQKAGQRGQNERQDGQDGQVRRDGQDGRDGQDRQDGRDGQVGRDGQHENKAPGFFGRIHDRFNQRFERLRDRYKGMLEWSLDHRGWVVGLFGVFYGASMLLLLFVGRDFFPYVDSGQMRLHVRAPAGTRIEETEQIFGAIEQELRKAIPADELDVLLDNIGLPNGGFNLGFGDTATVGPADGEILISLKADKHGPTQEYQRSLRERLAQIFPQETFFFQAANITNQILNFGLPAPIDIQVIGRDPHNYQLAQEIRHDVGQIPGAVDVLLRQETNAPTVQVNVDRTKASEAGLTQRDVANSLLISLSSSGQIAPTQWLNPQNGVSYQIAVQTPQYRVDSFDALQHTPITGTGAAPQQILGNLAGLERTTSTVIVNHYNVQPVYDVYASVDRRDLGGVANAIDRVLDGKRKNLPQGTQLVLRGQVATMRSSFLRLEIGLVFAVLFVYLLMVVNFQSWLDPFIILTALPGALSGVLWMLFLTQTTLNVPSLMGAIMSIGVATANSILLVVFANDERAEGKNEHEAALSAGHTRIRPVLMTALAMIIGMLPMALAFGEGGEQNAPLGRAVIGGLLLATATTLFFVPVIYSYLRTAPPEDLDREIDEEYHAGEQQKA